MKTKRETERRGYGEAVEMDCGAGPHHRDFIYGVPTTTTHVVFLDV